MNREEWLTAAVNELRPIFKRAGYTIPPAMYLSVGWPSTGGTRGKNKTIGQAWSPENSADKVGHVFISPVLSDANEVLATLVHEVGHIVVGLKHGHKAPFVRFCKAIKLEGKPTATYASEALVTTLNELIEKIGPYPHGALAPGERKKQGTRLLKVLCPDCGYVIRVTQKWLDEGYPTCPCGAIMCDPDMLGEDNDVLRQSAGHVEYEAHGGRFKIIYTKTMNAGRILTQKYLVTDFEAHAVKASTIDGKGEFILDAGIPVTTPLPTRDDVLGFMQAVLEGVYTYTDSEIIDEIEDHGADGDDFLLPDEIEVPDAEDFSDEEWLRECERQVRESFPKWDDDKVYAEVAKRAADAYPKPTGDEPVEIAPF